MFNMRIKEFYDTQQIQILSKAQKSKGEVYKKKINRDTGEITSLERGKLVYNPFTEKVERMTEYKPVSAEEYARRSCSRTIKAIYDIARCDRWEWFLTFTFSPERVNRFEYSECTQKLSDWLANMRRVAPNMKYIVVPEQHKDGAWHFHGLMKDVKGLQFKFSGHRDKRGRRVYNVHDYKFGWTTATRVTDFRRSSSYLCKYVTKDLCAVTKGKKRYWHSLNLNTPVVHEFLLNDSFEYNYMEILRCCEEDVHVKLHNTSYTKIFYVDGKRQSQVQSIPQTHVFRIDCITDIPYRPMVVNTFSKKITPISFYWIIIL